MASMNAMNVVSTIGQLSGLLHAIVFFLLTLIFISAGIQLYKASSSHKTSAVVTDIADGIPYVRYTDRDGNMRIARLSSIRENLTIGDIVPSVSVKAKDHVIDEEISIQYKSTMFVAASSCAIFTYASAHAMFNKNVSLGLGLITIAASLYRFTC